MEKNGRKINSRKLIAIDRGDEDGIQVWAWGDEPMPRYVDQKDKYCCGPIALINALKWAGKKISWKANRAKLIKDTQCCPHHGSYPQDLENALRKYGKGLFTVRYRERMKLKDICAEISKGRAIVINYTQPKNKWSKDGDGHYCLLIDVRYDEERGEKYFGLVNAGVLSEGLAVEYITAKAFKSLCLRRFKDDNWWILRRINPLGD